MEILDQIRTEQETFVDDEWYDSDGEVIDGKVQIIGEFNLLDVVRKLVARGVILVSSETPSF